jgi:PhnB protein
MTSHISIGAYVCVKGAGQAIEYYKKAFGAVEIMRMADRNGKVGRAEIRIDDAVLMLADEYPEMGFLSPQTLNGTTFTLALMVPNVDEVVERAVAAGGRLERPVKNEFYGHRAGTVLDPFGHRWHIATEIEQVSIEEMHRRAAALHGEA